MAGDISIWKYKSGPRIIKEKMIIGVVKDLFLLFGVVIAQVPEALQDKGNVDPNTLREVETWYSNFDEYQRLTGPMFDNNTVVNTTVQLGGIAFLHCKVRNLGERTITWLRRRDWHILTSGMLTYTNDERFQVLHHEGTDDWTLQIKYVQKRDNGTYECQVSTGGGILSHFVNLDIVVPEAFIVGGREHHVVHGGTINLVCVIEKSPTPPQYVLWYHNSKMINYDTSRGGVQVRTEQGQKTESHLTIGEAKYSDSGNYTCSASNTQSASITVFVSEGDKMAAISPRKSSSGVKPQSSTLGLLYPILLYTVLCSLPVTQRIS